MHTVCINAPQEVVFLTKVLEVRDDRDGLGRLEHMFL